MASDEAGGAGDQNREPRLGVRSGRITGLGFPILAMVVLEGAALSGGGGGGRGAKEEKKQEKEEEEGPESEPGVETEAVEGILRRFELSGGGGDDGVQV